MMVYINVASVFFTAEVAGRWSDTDSLQVRSQSMCQFHVNPFSFFLAKHMSSGSDGELRNDVKLDKHLEGHEETINKNINTVEVR